VNRKKLAGLAAAAVLAAIVAGGGAVLAWASAAFGPSHWPSAGEVARVLTSPDDGTVLAGILVVVGWAAWAYLTATIAADLWAGLRGRAPSRARALGLGRLLTGRLVAAVVALAVAGGAAMAVAPPVAAAPPAGGPAAAAPERPGAGAAGRPAGEHVVAAGENLSSIAAAELGDPGRWPELFAATRGQPQPVGWPVEDPDQIDVGQIVRLPGAPPGRAGAGRGTPHTVAQDETMWGLAETYLGDPGRWPEIQAANPAADPLALPLGETIVIPPAAPGPAAAPAEAPALPPAAPPAAAPAPPSQAAAAGAGQAPSEPAGRPSGGPAPAPAASPGESGTPAGPAGPAAAEGGLMDRLPPAPIKGGITTTLGAGLVLVLWRRRARRGFKAPPGAPPVAPAGAEAAHEGDARSVGDADLVGRAGQAFRRLTARGVLPRVELARMGRPVRRDADGRPVSVGGGRVELMLSGPAELPAPWRAVEPNYWVCDLDDVDQPAGDGPETLRPIRAAGQDEGRAPYPGLVCVGADEEDMQLFVDLEHLRVLGISGDPGLVGEMQAAIAVGLATGQTADDIVVTTVGTMCGLDSALQTGSLAYTPTLAAELDRIEREAAGDRRELEEAGVGSAREARAAGVAPGTWYPNILIIPGSVTPSQRQRLGAVLAAQPEVALAAVAADDEMADGHQVRITVEATDRAILSPWGLPFRPQRLTDDALTAWQSILLGADQERAPAPPGRADAPGAREDPPAALPGDTAAAEPRDSPPEGPVACPPAGWPAPDGAARGEPGRDTPRDARPPVPADEPAHPDGAGEADAPAAGGLSAPGPMVRVLGPPSVEGAPGPIEPSKAAKATELLAFLLLNRGATAPQVDESLWPSATNEAGRRNTRATLMSKARRWLGEDGAGNEWLPKNTCVPSPGLRTDWDLWRDLVGRPKLVDGVYNFEAIPDHQLEEALALVRGRPFEGANNDWYRWADGARLEIVAQIAAAAAELARRRFDRQDYAWAAAAAAQGLRVDVGSEDLWRLRIESAQRGGDRAGMLRAAEDCLTIADELGCGLEPETVSVIDRARQPA